MSAGRGVAPAAGPGPVDDPSIPVLTDRIYLPAVELDMALPAAPVAASTEQAAVPGEAERRDPGGPGGRVVGHVRVTGNGDEVPPCEESHGHQVLEADQQRGAGER